MLTDLGSRVVVGLALAVAALAIGQAVYRGASGDGGPGIEVRLCQRVMGRDGVYAQECVDAR